MVFGNNKNKLMLMDGKPDSESRNLRRNINFARGALQAINMVAFRQRRHPNCPTSLVDSAYHLTE